MQFYRVSLSSLMWRYYLMMGVVIVSFMANMPLLAFLSIPIFMSALMGIKLTWKRGNQADQNVKNLKSSKPELKDAA
jgi:hypothetical protein